MLRGTFSRKGADGAVFNFNPNGLLSYPAHGNFNIRSFENIPFDVEVIAEFAVRASKFSSEASRPYIKNIKAAIGTRITYVEPLLNVLPNLFVQELADFKDFGFFAGIGIPENPFLPSLSFDDFCFLKEGPVVWKRVADLLITKYEKLSEMSEIDNVLKKEHTRFYDSLLKHSGGSSRSTCI